MAYLCQNCGVVDEDAANICNPIDEQYKHKACSEELPEVCLEHVSDMQYSCDCGKVSAHPQHLCHPRKTS